MAIDPNPAEVIGLVAREHDDSRCSMYIRILGPLEASIDDQPVAIGGAKQRAVLAMLVLEANHAVTGDRLIEGLWGDDPPASAPKMVQNYVWRLRGALPSGGGAEILTRGRAYELRIDRDRVDVCRFERLVLEASRAATAGRPTSAAREALALFRGDPLADLAEQPFADPEIRRLEELRLAATELAIDADLAAGRHHELVGELDALWPRTRCASGCTRSACSRCTGAAARPRRSRRTGTPGRPWSRRSASSRRPSSGICTRRSSAKTPRWTSRPSPSSSRTSSTRPPHRH